MKSLPHLFICLIICNHKCMIYLPLLWFGRIKICLLLPWFMPLMASIGPHACNSKCVICQSWVWGHKCVIKMCDLSVTNTIVCLSHPRWVQEHVWGGVWTWYTFVYHYCNLRGWSQMYDFFVTIITIRLVFLVEACLKVSLGNQSNVS